MSSSQHRLGSVIVLLTSASMWLGCPNDSGPSKRLYVTIAGSGQGSVGSNFGGLSCSTGGSGTCNVGLPRGAIMMLTASPASSSIFVGWSGCSTATTASISVSQPALPAGPVDQTCTATFQPKITLNISLTGSGAGTVASVPAGIDCPPATCTADFQQGSLVTLTATPSAASDFKGWTGHSTCTSPINPVLVLTPGTTLGCSVQFDLKSVQVTVLRTGTGTGSVTSSPAGIACPVTCAANFPGNSAVTLTATADPSSSFVGWTGCSTSTNAVLAITASTAITCTARFDVPVQVTVVITGNGIGSVTSNPPGIACPGTCAANFPGSSAVTLTAASDPGSIFSGWTGCSTSAAAVLAITASAPMTCTARFDLKTGVVVISDDFDDAGAFARWDIALRDQPAGTLTSESNPTTGGSPGGYRAGRYDFTVSTPPALTVRVDHILRGDASHAGTYTPSQSGPVDSLLVSMDRLVTHAPNVGAMVGSLLVLRQGANLFYASIDPGNAFGSLTWQLVKKTLVPGDFFSSPAGTFPDFNAPMEFGFRRTTTFSASAANAFISWGTDNFRVEVWHH